MNSKKQKNLFYQIANILSDFQGTSKQIQSMRNICQIIDFNISIQHRKIYHNFPHKSINSRRSIPYALHRNIAVFTI